MTNPINTKQQIATSFVLWSMHGDVSCSVIRSIIEWMDKIIARVVSLRPADGTVAPLILSIISTNKFNHKRVRRRRELCPATDEEECWQMIGVP